MVRRKRATYFLRSTLGVDLAFKIRAFFAIRPKLFFGAQKIVGKDTSRAINDDTQLLIAGIWGCANTYASQAFAEHQPGIAFSHHVHVPAQVVEAANRNLPCLVLIRHPIDAVASYTSREHLDLSLRDMHWALKDYAFYYNSIVNLKDSYTTSDFKEVISEYPAAFKRLNDKFNTSFSVPANDSDEAKDLRERNKYKGKDRRYAIDDIKDFICQPNLEKNRVAAEEAYERFCIATDTPIRKDEARPPMARRYEKGL
jgi:hypothetical protein